VDPKVVAPRPSIVDPFVPFIVEQLQKYPEPRSTRLHGSTCQVCIRIKPAG